VKWFWLAVHLVMQSAASYDNMMKLIL